MNNVCVPGAVAPAYAPSGAALISVTVLEEVALKDTALEAAVRTQLSDWFGSSVNRWQHLRTYRLPQALPAQAPPALSSPQRPVRLHSGLYVCGDHRETASIHGAMVSGRRAAEAIIEDLNACKENPVLWLVLAHVAATLIMVGVIWFVQIVHYPLFNQVGEATFNLYEMHHARLTTYVVAPAMLIEMATGLWLLWQRPVAILPVQVWLGMGCLATIWLSTFFVQVPQHDLLAQGFDPLIHPKLVTSNWLRTIAWSARGPVVLWMVTRLIPPDFS